MLYGKMAFSWRPLSDPMMRTPLHPIPDRPGQSVRRALPAAALLLVASGCADIQAAREAQDPKSAGPGERTVTASEIGLGPGSTLTLERGLRLSLEYNPSTALARRAVDAARARVRQANAGSLPTLSVGGSYDLSGGKDVSGTDQSFSANAAAGLLLYDFGKTPALQREAAEQLLATALDLRSSENDVAFSFQQAFYNVLKQIELVRVSEETVRQFEKRLEQVRGFVEVGTRVKYDLTKAQVDLGNAQLNLVTSRTALTVQQAILGNTLGLAEVPPYALEKPATTPEEPLPIGDLMQEAHRQHPRLLAQSARERAASAAVDAAVANLYPDLSLRGSFTATGPLTPVNWFWSAGPSLSWLVFGGWAQVGQLNETVAGLQSSRAALAQAEQLVFLDIQQALAIREDARQRLAILVLTVRQAEENLDLVQSRYAIGKASSVELTDAQVALATARGNKIQSEYEYRISDAQLKRAVGAPPIAPKGNAP
jgi:outer membrane protein